MFNYKQFKRHYILYFYSISSISHLLTSVKFASKRGSNNVIFSLLSLVMSALTLYPGPYPVIACKTPFLINALIVDSSLVYFLLISNRCFELSPILLTTDLKKPFFSFSALPPISLIAGLSNI